MVLMYKPITCELLRERTKSSFKTYFSGMMPFMYTSGSRGNGRGSNDAKFILNASGSASNACKRSVCQHNNINVILKVCVTLISNT